jgi:hypothetical protein
MERYSEVHIINKKSNVLISIKCLEFCPIYQIIHFTIPNTFSNKYKNFNALSYFTFHFVFDAEGAVLLRFIGLNKKLGIFTLSSLIFFITTFRYRRQIISTKESP